MSNQPTENKALAVIDPAVMSHKKFLDVRMENLAKWVHGGLRPESLIRFALHDLSTNEKLRACTPQSIYLGLLACAVTGLEPGSLKGEAYLVPFGGKDKQGNQMQPRAQFVAGWKGLVKQARRSQAVKMITPNIVCERDVFDFDLGTANYLKHKPVLRDRGDIVGAYAWAKVNDDEVEIEWMDRQDLDTIREFAESRGRSSAWSDWPDQMMRKSPLRRLAKRLPLGEDYYRGLAIERSFETGEGSQREALDVITDGEASETGGSEGMSASTFIGPPAQPPPEKPAAAPEKPKAGKGAKPIDAASTERPTSAGGVSPPMGPALSGYPAPSPASTPSTAAEAAARDDVRPTSPPASTPAASAPASPGPSGSGAAPDDGFGGTEDPVDTAAPKRTMLDFHAWLATVKDGKQLKAEAPPWMAWRRENFPDRSDNANEMSKAYAKRKSEVPE